MRTEDEGEKTRYGFTIISRGCSVLFWNIDFVLGIDILYVVL